MASFRTSLAKFVGIIALSCLHCEGENVTITKDPDSVSTCADREVTFSCEAENANLFFWFINGIYAKYAENVISDIETNDTVVPAYSILVVYIPPENFVHLNESMIKCSAVDFFGQGGSIPAESSPALLLIQGPIEPVPDVSVRADCDRRTMNLSWTKPYTLDGVTIPSYNICVTGNCSIHDGVVNGAILPFPAIDTYFADNYEICIQPHDCTTSTTTKTTCINATLNKDPVWIHYHDIQSMLTYADAFQVKIEVDLEWENICQVPHYYQILLTSPNRELVSLSPNLTHQSIFGANFVLILDEQLEESNVSLRINSCNSAGVNSSDIIQFALFHVQEAFLDGNNITCRFVAGSNARGCSTSLICVNGMVNVPLQTCLISRVDEFANGSINCQKTPLNCTSYNIYVYDQFFDGTVSSQEAYVLWNVTFTPPPTTSNLWWIAAVVVPFLVLVLTAIFIIALAIHCRKTGKYTLRNPFCKKVCNKKEL